MTRKRWQDIEADMEFEDDCDDEGYRGNGYDEIEYCNPQASNTDLNDV